MGKPVSEIYAEFELKKEARKKLFKNIFTKVKKLVLIVFVLFFSYKFFSGQLSFSTKENSVTVKLQLTEDIEKNEALVLRAKDGDIKSQTILGFKYFEGIGFKQDYKKAIYWLNKSAISGDAVAQDTLAYMYLKKLGGLDDDEKTIYWYTQSANQNKVSSQLNLAFIYKDGLIEQDDAKSLHWFKKAAEQGNSEAQFNLAVMLIKGSESEGDNKKGAFWLMKAAEQGHQDALKTIEEYYKK